MIDHFQYNAPVILTFFFLSLLALILNIATKAKSNRLLFMSYRSSPFNLLTYVRLFTHVLGHYDWSHFRNNFLIILLIGPMIEEKYGSFNVLMMILITAGITGFLNVIFSKRSLLGASGIAFMFIIVSSLVNIHAGKVPITFILISMFYIFDEIWAALFKKDNVSHISHLIGAVCGAIYGFYIM